MPHARRDAASQRITLTYWNFYSHASCEAWRIAAFLLPLCIYFYSHASCEAWPAGWLSSPPHLVFLLTRLMRGVTPHIHAILSVPQFLLTRLMRGVTPSVQSWKVPDTISTHTPHARRDIFSWYYVNNFRISTHTPHARRDLNPPFRARLRQNFYSHASCEAWQHFPLGHCSQQKNFYSHASCEAWPCLIRLSDMPHFISTHTPHARRDLTLFFLWLLGNYFYSHASCEAWPHSFWPPVIFCRFLLTRLMRGVTAKYTNISQSHHSI